MESALNIIENPESLLAFNSHNELEFDSLNLHELGKTIDEPLFIFSPNKLKQNIDKFRTQFGEETIIAYPVKTNRTKSVLDIISKNKCTFVVSSLNELAKIIAFKEYGDVIYNNPAMSEKEATKVAEEKIGFIVIESLEQLKLLNRCAEKVKTKANVLLRVKTSIVPKNSAYGTSIDLGLNLDEFKTALEELEWMPHINLKGIHNHLRTQNIDINSWQENLEEISVFLVELKKRDIDLQYLDLGGGFPSTYIKEAPSIKEIYSAWETELTQIKRDFPETTVIIEPGRSIAADAFVLLTKVLVEKKGNEENKIIILNTSTYISSVDTMLAGIELPVIPTKIMAEENKEKKSHHIRGCTLDPIDIFRDKVFLPEIKTHQSLIFLNIGAYVFSTDLYDLEKPRITAVKSRDT
ncbi:diaminopimelate decarboxylase family protein [Nanoarchaeota archaeon]